MLRPNTYDWLMLHRYSFMSPATTKKGLVAIRFDARIANILYFYVKTFVLQ